MTLRAAAWTALLLTANTAYSFPRVEGGNDYYRAVITGTDRSPRSVGHYTTFTGPNHPVTRFLARPGDLISVHRDCVSCGGDDDLTFSVVRSWDSRTDYVLARNPYYILEPDPGFDCLAAESLALPTLETVFDGGAAVGVKSSWDIVNGSDDLYVEQLLRVHGEDFVGSRVEITLAVTNGGGAPARIGLREIWNLAVTSPLTPANPAGLGTAGNFFLGLRPPDPPDEPFGESEREWDAPGFRMWQAHAANPTPSVTPFRYSIAGAISGPATLDPIPTAPDLLQHSAMNLYAGLELPPGGALDRCFEWHVPDPPRRVVYTKTMGIVSYWGLDEADAIELLPGEEVRVTQYLVAFIEYPLEVDAGGSYESPCSASSVGVSIEGIVTLAEPTSAPVVVRWSSPDPHVSFLDDTAASTTAMADAVGDFPITFTASVGAYEASAVATLSVVDREPPEIVDLSVAPSVLWPPNHRMVPVRVRVDVRDDCDPAPRLRLVSASSSEPDDARGLGDGRTVDDIQEAVLGDADMVVLLRAERDGNGTGRSYTLTYEAEDSSGNVTTRSVDVVVPHDRRSRSASRAHGTTRR